MRNLFKSVAPIEETFVSVQGESFLTGLPTTFVRFVGCNLACSYCDTGYAEANPMKNRLKENYTVDELVKRIEYLGAPYVCFTGGEPLLHYSFIQELIKKLAVMWDEDKVDHTFRSFSIETNGTLPIDGVMRPAKFLRFRHENRLSFILDVKMEELKSSKHGSIIKHNLSTLLRAYDEAKIVVTHDTDLDEVYDLIKRFPEVEFSLSPVHNAETNTFDTADRVCDFIKTHKLPNTRAALQIHKILKQR